MLSDHPTSFGSLSEAQKDRKSLSATDRTQSPGCLLVLTFTASRPAFPSLPQSQTPGLSGPSTEPEA